MLHFFAHRGSAVSAYALVAMQIRAAVKKQSAGKYGAKVKARSRRREHVAAHPIPKDELGDVFK